MAETAVTVAAMASHEAMGVFMVFGRDGVSVALANDQLSSSYDPPPSVDPAHPLRQEIRPPVSPQCRI